MNKDFGKKIGKNIRTHRELARLQLQELADKISVRIDTLSKYEVGHRMPNAEVIYKIAGALKVTTDALLEPPGYDPTTERRVQPGTELITDELEAEERICNFEEKASSIILVSPFFPPPLLVDEIADELNRMRLPNITDEMQKKLADFRQKRKEARDHLGRIQVVYLLSRWEIETFVNGEGIYRYHPFKKYNRIEQLEEIINVLSQGHISIGLSTDWNIEFCEIFDTRMILKPMGRYILIDDQETIEQFNLLFRELRRNATMTGREKVIEYFRAKIRQLHQKKRDY